VENIGKTRTSILIPVYGNYELFERCLLQVLKHSPKNILIHIFDDCFPGQSAQNFLECKNIQDERLRHFRQPVNLGFVGNCNSFMNQNIGENVILLNSDALVGPGWWEAMHAPIGILDNIATVTALTNEGGLSTVVLSGNTIPFLDEEALESLNQKLLGDEVGKFAYIPVGIGHCMLITSRALSLVGLFDDIFSPGYSEEVDFSLRATKLGMVHILANTFVSHSGGDSFGEKRLSLQESHHKIIEARYPGYTSLVMENAINNQGRELMFSKVFQAYQGLKVLVDGRMLSDNPTGTSRLILETIQEMSTRKSLSVSVVVPGHLLKKYRSEFTRNIQVFDSDGLNAISKNGPQFDVLYRPCQFNHQSEILDAKIWAHRLVLCHLDFISYGNFQYFANVFDYFRYRDVTDKALHLADSVTYISRYVLQESQILFDRKCAYDTVIYCGVDHFLPREPFRSKNNPQKKILMYGAAFAHKNRAYAIKLIQAMHQMGSNVELNIVGPRPTFGDSENEESLALKDLSCPENVKFSPWIKDEILREKIREADLVLYPSGSEGFGFVPFEAAALGTPTLFSGVSSLGELLPKAPYFLTFDLNDDAKMLLQVLGSEQHLRKIHEYIDVESHLFKWKFVVDKLIQIFEDVVSEKNLVPRNLAFDILLPRSVGHEGLKIKIVRVLSNIHIFKFIFPLGSAQRKFVRRFLRL
jgi:glycosyltransferase involved in cell wall biosynthesis